MEREPLMAGDCEHPLEKGWFPCSPSEKQHTFTMLDFCGIKNEGNNKVMPMKKSTFYPGLWAERNTSHPFYLFSLIRKGK